MEETKKNTSRSENRRCRNGFYTCASLCFTFGPKWKITTTEFNVVLELVAIIHWICYKLHLIHQTHTPKNNNIQHHCGPFRSQVHAHYKPGITTNDDDDEIKECKKNINPHIKHTYKQHDEGRLFESKRRTQTNTRSYARMHTQK